MQQTQQCKDGACHATNKITILKVQELKVAEIAFRSV